MTRYNKVVAKLIPASEDREPDLPDFSSRAENIFSHALGNNASAVLEEQRDERT
ncbi:MAG: hypothetical protein ACLFR1_12560 [Spirochaetia bacterium]